MVNGASSLVDCVSGTINTGASLTIKTDILTFALSDAIPSVTKNVVGTTPKSSLSVTPILTVSPSISIVTIPIVSEKVL